MADSRSRRYLPDDAFDHVVPVPSLPYVEPDRTKRVGDHAQHIPTPFSRRQVSLMVAIGMSLRPWKFCKSLVQGRELLKWEGPSILNPDKYILV